MNGHRTVPTLTVQCMFKVSAEGYKKVSGVALGSLCVIVVSGALVRLTGSGLGCSDWPRCNSTKFVDVSSGHTLIEQANRLFTGVVSLSVIAAVLLAYRLETRRRDLVLLSWGLVVGVLAQVIIGGIVVLTGLNPFANMAHFLVSMVLVSCALVLYRRAQQAAHDAVWRPLPTRLRRQVQTLCVLGFVAVVTGTVVTATGPHAGDEDAVRLGFELVSVARVHSISVILVLTMLVLLSRIVIIRPPDREFVSALHSTLFVAMLQGAIGYTQYFTGVPVQLVALHIVGATAFVLSIVNLALNPERSPIQDLSASKS